MVELRINILVITSGGGSRSRIYNAVTRILETPEIRREYGDVKDNENKTMGEVWLKPELQKVNSIDPQLRVVGRLSDIIGSHVDLILLEDIIQAPFKSNESEDSLKDWISMVVLPINAPISGSATRKSPDDLYGYLESELEIPLFTRSAFTSEGKYPERSDFELRKGIHPKLNKEIEYYQVRKDYDLSEFTLLDCPNYNVHTMLWRRGFTSRSIRAFENEMMQRPLAKEGAWFSVDDWRVVPDLPMEIIKNNCYIAVDPAFGKSNTADWFVILVGVVYQSKLYIVHNFMKKAVGFFRGTQLIREYYDMFNPKIIFVEDEFHQAWLRQAAARLVPNIKPVNRRSRQKMEQPTKKTERIDTLDVPFELGQILMCESMGNMGEAKKQFIQYDRKDSTPSKKDDFLDALEILYQRVKGYLINSKFEYISWN